MDDLVEQLESITDRVALISPSGVMTDGVRYRDAIVADLRALTAQLAAQPAPAVEVAAVTRVPQPINSYPEIPDTSVDTHLPVAASATLAQCSDCGWRGEWPDSDAGRRGACPSCGDGALIEQSAPRPTVFADTDPEARFIADGERLNCPTCGGSGHVGDVRPEARADDGLDYLGKCSQCGGRFIGHKRQAVCDECRDKQTEATPDQCAAISTGHTMANDGPNGSRQCKFCGKPEAKAVADERERRAWDAGRAMQRALMTAQPKPAEDEPEAPAGADDIYTAYRTWPIDLRAKLSLHDLRRMSGWAPRPNPAGWAIDTSAGRPILVLNGCSVIEAEDARYVLSLIRADQQPKPAEGGAAADVVANLAGALRNLTSGEGDTREHVMRAWEALSAYDALRQTVRTEAEMVSLIVGTLERTLPITMLDKTTIERHSIARELFAALQPGWTKRAGEAGDAPAFDAGLLNDFGGGDVAWWHDYICRLLNDADEHYRQYIAPAGSGEAVGEVVEGRLYYNGVVKWYGDPLKPGAKLYAGAPPADAEALKVNDGEVLVVVHGLTGSGKSAVAGEIEILCKALGLDVRWENGDEEKFLTHADWTHALELYKPRVRIVEVNTPRGGDASGGDR